MARELSAVHLILLYVSLLCWPDFYHRKFGACTISSRLGRWQDAVQFSVFALLEDSLLVVTGPAFVRGDVIKTGDIGIFRCRRVAWLRLHPTFFVDNFFRGNTGRLRQFLPSFLGNRFHCLALFAGPTILPLVLGP